MKIAFMTDDGNVTTYGNVGMGTVSVSGDEMTLEFDVSRQANGDFGRTHVAGNAKDGLIKFFGLGALKTGRRIPKNAIRKGDLIRMVDISDPMPGERDYRTLEYVATEDHDSGYPANAGEKFYLLDRPKPVWPDAPGSVVRAREKYGPRQTAVWTLGSDGQWRRSDDRGPMTGTDKQVKSTHELVEVMH